jgi:ParB/RepB/Spo0J family partition protein
MTRKSKGIVRPDFSRERDRKLDLSEMFASSMSTQIAGADGRPGATMEDARLLPLELIDHNPYQARQTFDLESLRELADSISEHGVIEPVIVRANEGRYEIVAGERRYRAAIMAEQETIPARIMDLDARQAAIVTALENLQREDLDIEDEARQFAYLCDVLEVSQRELARMLGKNPVYISRRVRLLKRPDLMEEYRAGRLTMLQAAALAEPVPGEDKEDAEGDSPRITLAELSDVEQPGEAGEAGEAGTPEDIGEETQFELIERDDLPGFIVARSASDWSGGLEQSDSRRITSAGSPEPGRSGGSGRSGARRALFRWRPVTQFYNWVGRTHVSEVPSDERATLKVQLTEIRDALDKQIAELEQLEGGGSLPPKPEEESATEEHPKQEQLG